MICVALANRECRMHLLKGSALVGHSWTPVRDFTSRTRRRVFPTRSAVESEPPAAVAAADAAEEILCFDVSVQVLPHPDKIVSALELRMEWEAGGKEASIPQEPAAWSVDYSRQIMQIASEKLREEGDVKSALDMAHAKTRLPGSCTACLVKLDGATGQLASLNLGDSGFVVLRENQILKRTSPQQHFFDCPKQLAAFPEHCDQTDYARDGQSISLQLQEGDLVIMGTDGLWDNVFDESILKFTSMQHGRKKTVDELAEGLARLAQRNSLDPEFASPYILAALEEGYEVPWYEKLTKAKVKDWKVEWGTLTGGKMDDITVIVASVTRDTFPVTSVPQEQ